jgi:hypothetical protein
MRFLAVLSVFVLFAALTGETVSGQNLEETAGKNGRDEQNLRLLAESIRAKISTRANLTKRIEQARRMCWHNLHDRKQSWPAKT